MRSSVLLALVLTGCIRYSAYPVMRTVGGQERVGVFVAPSQYEDFVRAELAASAGDWRGAADGYQRARSGGEDDVLLLSRLADALDHLGDRTGAERALGQAIALDGHAEIAWVTRGVLAERHGENEAALEAYARAHDAEPTSEEPVLALARLLAATGHADRAASLLADFVAHATTPLASTRAALALALAEGDAAALADAATQLVRIAPGHTDEIEAAVRALRARGDAVIAERLITRLPPDVVDRELAIEVAIASGDRAAAERWLAFPRDEHPRSLTADARHWLALGDPARAAELAEVARGDAEAGSEATVVLAQARLASGAPAEAARLFASIPRGSSVDDEARLGLVSALAAAGLPALGDEIAR